MLGSMFVTADFLAWVSHGKIPIWDSNVYNYKIQDR